MTSASGLIHLTGLTARGTAGDQPLATLLRQPPCCRCSAWRPAQPALNVPGSCCCQLWDVSFLTVTFALHLFAGWWTLRRKLRGEGTAHHISSTVAAVAEG